MNPSNFVPVVETSRSIAVQSLMLDAAFDREGFFERVGIAGFEGMRCVMRPLREQLGHGSAHEPSRTHSRTAVSPIIGLNTAPSA